MEEITKIYVGDVGTLIKVDCKRSLAEATVLQMLVRKPDGTSVVWSGTLYPENNEYMTYKTVLGDVDQEGIWRLQAYVELPSWSGRGATFSFKVFGDFE